MTLADYDEVYALWKSLPGLGIDETTDSREGVERYLRRNPATCFVAREDSSLLGAIMAGHDGRRGYISHTAVCQAAQGRGVGRALVAAVMDGMRKEGIGKVFLVAFKTNAPGNAFWQHMGFTLREDLNYRDQRTGL